MENYTFYFALHNVQPIVSDTETKNKILRFSEKLNLRLGNIITVK